MNLGPDAARYWLAGGGAPVARPFHLRWLLPALCCQHVKRWRAVWLLSWPVAAVGAVWWARGMGAAWWPSVAAAAFLLALPGILGPKVARPVGVDLPALALSLLAAGAFANGLPAVGILFALCAAATKESAPVWIALWVWSPWPLVALLAPAIAAVVRRPQMDEVTALPQLRAVHDHPVRTALEAHRHQWRDGWVMVAPWGACLAGLIAPTPQVAATLAVAHTQLLVATDTVRLVATAVGPVLALAAAQVIPVPWLLLAVVLHVVWFRKPEFV